MNQDGKSSFVELASGVDALYASSRPIISKEFFDGLMILKAESNSEDSLPSFLTIGNEHYHVGKSAWGKYPVYLEHEFGRIGFSQSGSLPGVRLQIRSKFLHNLGAEQSLLWFSNRLEEMGILTYWTLSRLDLYTDLQGWSPRASDKSNFLTRATDINYYEQNDDFSGFIFGTRKSGTVLCRIYNKTREIQKKSDGWTPLIWGDRVDLNLSVWRVEFETSTKFLHQVGIENAIDGLNKRANLWAHFTEEWLTLRNPTSDSNKSRWPISEVWEFIQNSSLRGSAVPLERIRKAQSEASLEALLPPFKGYLTSIATRLGATTSEEAFAITKSFLEKNEYRSKNTIEEILSYKRKKFFI